MKSWYNILCFLLLLSLVLADQFEYYLTNADFARAVLKNYTEESNEHGVSLLEHEQPRKQERRVKRAIPGAWPDGVIPYAIRSPLSSNKRATLADAIHEIETSSCFRFVPRNEVADDKKNNFVSITTENEVCEAPVGFYRGENRLALSDNSVFSNCWSKATVLHELMHVIGFHHEHARPDRDEYVNVYDGNIDKDQKYNFVKYDWDEFYNTETEYDYYSIMHYSAFHFSKFHVLPTILPKDRGARIPTKDFLNPSKWWSIIKTTVKGIPKAFDPVIITTRWQFIDSLSDIDKQELRERCKKLYNKNK